PVPCLLLFPYTTLFRSFAGSVMPMLSCHAPETWMEERIYGVAHTEVSSSVALSLQSKHCIRSRMDTAINTAGEVDSEKWKLQIGDRKSTRLNSSHVKIS